MLELEDQIRRIADVSFDATLPVTVDRREVTARRRPAKVLAIAAAAICVAGVGGLLAVAAARDGDDPGIQQFAIAEPGAVDMDQAIDISEQQRLSAIGPLLSFDYDQLPGGWEHSVNFTITTGLSTPSYWQQVDVTTPEGVRLVVNVEGSLHGDSPLQPSGSDQVTGEPVDVRGQQGRQTGSSLRWIEQGATAVDILRGPGEYADASADMVELARLLEPVRDELDWSDEPPGGSPLEDPQPLLAGTIAATPWQVAVTGSGPVLTTGIDQLAHGQGAPLQDDPNTIELSIAPVTVPGGVVIYGEAPASVERVELRTLNSVTRVPTAPLNGDRTTFAVPIDDRLDPVSVDFFDSDGQLLAALDVSGLPPYLGGVTSTRLQI